ncbi:unnamed protein product [Schistocephalus solidus]|uniref:Homeobox domain-containing protein n=1 Tax=Schistocephalus solidus TaxID=70667 RepID=A0A183TR05_SCHSO|nr:unnamed protein product [Schistocephalus solidus]
MTNAAGRMDTFTQKNETSRSSYQQNDDTSTLTGSHMSRKGQSSVYAPQLTRMSELLRTDHCTSKCNSQLNSVYCYGDGPVLGHSHKTAQRPRKSTTFDARESNTSASNADKIGSQSADATDGNSKNNKRQKLLAWLKASQAKRDENNRQVFSRWIEKIDSERPKAHSTSHHGPTFYCDQFPQPQMLVSAMQSYPGGSAGVPLIYVGYPPASIPSHAENLTAYNFGQMKSHHFTFGNSIIPNQDHTVPPVMRPLSPTERVGSSVSFKFDQNPSFEPCEVKSHEVNQTRVEGDPSQNFETLSSNDQRPLSSPMAVPTIMPSSSNYNYIDPQMMFFMPYMGYNQGQSPAMSLQSAGAVAGLKNLSSSRLATPFCPSPFVTADGQMPMFMLGQVNNWYNGTGTNQSCNLTIPPSSSQSMSFGTCGQYTPNMNRYLYQPAGAAAAGEANQPATSGTPGSSFDFQHWISALDEIGKDHHRNTVSETSEAASTLE